MRLRLHPGHLPILPPGQTDVFIALLWILTVTEWDLGDKATYCSGQGLPVLQQTNRAANSLVWTGAVPCVLAGLGALSGRGWLGQSSRPLLRGFVPAHRSVLLWGNGCPPYPPTATASTLTSTFPPPAHSSSEATAEYWCSLSTPTPTWKKANQYTTRWAPRCLNLHANTRGMSHYSPRSLVKDIPQAKHPTPINRMHKYRCQTQTLCVTHKLSSQILKNSWQD